MAQPVLLLIQGLLFRNERCNQIADAWGIMTLPVVEPTQTVRGELHGTARGLLSS
jgi:hypothetical protein